jgi:hypothetical protein
VLSGEVFTKLIGIGLAAAVLIGATVVRMVLVPAVMQLLGERNWRLPRWLDRAVPELELEAQPVTTRWQGPTVSFGGAASRRAPTLSRARRGSPAA